MEYFSPEDWLKFGIANDVHKLFVLHWEEVFHPTTPDTWQVRTSNIKTVMRELVEAVDTATVYEKSRHNIPLLLTEARQMALLDPVLSSHFPFVRDYLPDPDSTEPHSADVEENGKPEVSSTGLQETRRLAKVVLGRLQGYEQLLVADLRQILSDADTKQKEKLYNLTLALATEFAAKGYSMSHLGRAADLLLDASLPNFVDRFDAFARACDGGGRKYVCTIGVNWPREVSPADFRYAPIRLTTGRPYGPLLPDEERVFGRAATRDVFAELSTTAIDVESAVNQCEARLVAVLATIQAYLVHGVYTIRGQAALVRETSDESAGRPFAVSLSRTRRIYSHEVSEPGSHINQFLQIIEGLGSDDDTDQFNAALQYHKLAMSAPSEESALVNLWISLECLCRRSRGGPIIERVCDHVGASVAVGNLRKTVESLTRYVYPLWVEHGTDRSRELFPRSNEATLSPEDVLDALLDVNEGAKINELYRIVGSHLLLCYRTFRIRKLFRTPDSARENLLRHRRNVNWQLRRIYRARNHITHQGRGVSGLPHLIQHLHTYFLITFHNLVHDLKSHPGWAIPEALSHRRILFEHFVKRLGAADRVVPRQALLDPSRILVRSNDTPAWPPSPPSAEPPDNRKRSGRRQQETPAPSGPIRGVPADEETNVCSAVPTRPANVPPLHMPGEPEMPEIPEMTAPDDAYAVQHEAAASEPKLEMKSAAGHPNQSGKQTE